MLIPRCSLELEIPQMLLHRILHKDLDLIAFKVQLTQEFKPSDHKQRRVFTDFESIKMIRNLIEKKKHLHC